ncbi:MAG: hypothetical protein ACP5NZ_01980 [Nanobdellota archaeon]
MVEIEVLIGHIKKSRRKGFKDDFIWKGLYEKGYSAGDINRAFSLSGRRVQFDIRHRSKKGEDASKTTACIVLDDVLRKALEKKAAKDNMTLYNEIKKILVENAELPELNRKEYLRLRSRYKLTKEAKDRHNISARNYSQRVGAEFDDRVKVKKMTEKEERKEARKMRREERKAKRKDF